MEDMHTNASAGISRRTFISGSAIAGTLAALGLAGCAPKTGTEKEMPATGASTSDISWDEECEVLVVGSGYSGLAAAIEAKNAGADVKIIEKMNRVGGNSAFAAGDMAVCGSKVQAREGIEDSVDAFVSDMLIAGLYLNDEEKCRPVSYTHLGHGRRRFVLWRALTTMLAVLSVAYCIFALMCGLNYYRHTFAEDAGFELRESSTAELTALCENLAANTNNCLLYTSRCV